MNYYKRKALELLGNHRDKISRILPLSYRILEDQIIVDKLLGDIVYDAIHMWDQETDEGILEFVLLKIDELIDETVMKADEASWIKDIVGADRYYDTYNQ